MYYSDIMTQYMLLRSKVRIVPSIDQTHLSESKEACLDLLLNFLGTPHCDQLKPSELKTAMSLRMDSLNRKERSLNRS